MVAVTATLYGDEIPPRVLVTVTGVLGAQRVQVWREPPNEAAHNVRGGDVVPSSDAVLVLDPTPELGRPLVYVAQVTDAAGDITQTTAQVTVPDPGRHVLSSPYDGRSVLVDLIATPDERRNDAAGTVLRPVGRRYPIAIHDVRSSDSGDLVVHTTSRAETLALEDLLADGAPVTSRHPYDGCDVVGVEVLYVAVTARSRRARDGSRVWTLPFDVVADPDPSLAAAMPTLAALATFVPGTLADIATTWPTLLDVASDPLGT